MTDMDRLPEIKKQSKPIRCIVENEGKYIRTIANIKSDKLTETTSIELNDMIIKFKTKDLKKGL